MLAVIPVRLQISPSFENFAMPTRGKVWCHCGIRCAEPREVSYSTWSNHNKEAVASGGAAIPQHDPNASASSAAFWQEQSRRNGEIARTNNAYTSKKRRRSSASQHTRRTKPALRDDMDLGLQPERRSDAITPVSSLLTCLVFLLNGSML